MPLIDISRSIHPSLAGWPGDTPFEFRLASTISANSPVNVGTVTISTHFGTHADAPFHFQNHGRPIDQLPLELFVGRAIVVDVCGEPRITRSILQAHDLHAAKRLLLRTDAWLDNATFPSNIPTMQPDVPDWLQSQGIVLLGVDVPSVDPLDSKDLPVHHALARNGIAILESLELRGVAAGVYELVALPLRLSGSDASPVRAVLRHI